MKKEIWMNIGKKRKIPNNIKKSNFQSMRIRSHNIYQSLIDAVLILLAWWLAFRLRFNLDLTDTYEDIALRTSIWVVISYALAWVVMDVQRQVWRYTGLPELRQTIFAVVVGALATTACLLMVRSPNFPRAVFFAAPDLGNFEFGWCTSWMA
jgi:FlaA1/EpsC-like NDP-sugar epimerase